MEEIRQVISLNGYWQFAYSREAPDLQTLRKLMGEDVSASEDFSTDECYDAGGHVETAGRQR